MEKEYTKKEVVGLIRDFVSEVVATPLDFALSQNKLKDFLEKKGLVDKEVKYPKGILYFYDSVNKYEHNHPFNDEYNKWVEFSLSVGRNILSVQNSSGEVLTVGDNTNHGVIESFVIMDMKILCFANKIKSNFLNINDVHPIKKVITEDGFERELNEFVWVVFGNMTTSKSKDQYTVECAMANGFKMFANYLNAEKYIDLHKKQFSKQDILDATYNFDGVVVGKGIERSDILSISKHKLGL